MTEPRARRSPRRNPLSTGEDELARAIPEAPTNDSGTPSHTPAVSRVLTPTPASAVASASIEAAAKYTDKDLQRATQLALNLFV